MRPDTLWAKVDSYFEDLLARQTAFEGVLARSRRARLPEIQVSPLQGRFLHLLARAIRARRILEIGTLGGYSAVWLASALPAGGTLVTLEVNPRHARVARENIARAGLMPRVRILEGAALDTLAALPRKRPFDLVFIDADKANNRAYFEIALRLTHAGSIIVVDNVVRGGKVVRSLSRDPSIRGTRNLIEFLVGNRRVEATVLQTVGRKGYDGMVVARVVAPTRRRA